MKTLSDPGVRASLTDRLERLTPVSARRWGTMTPHQMAVHLADAVEAVLKRRPFATPVRRARPVMKWVALYLPFPWPRGVRTGSDPASRVLPPDTFASDRHRAIAGLGDLAAAAPAALVDAHPIFGPMNRPDWLRWAFLHTDHHLRQFGL